MKANVLQRACQKCKGCNKTRIELAKPGFWEKLQITGVSFSKGYCPYCSSLRYAYHNQESLIQAHITNQSLRKLCQK